uniref:GIY-YIG endonuclease n=1 Tax=Cordyceps cicadae TaxID=218633 RepID=A0A481S235_9HYPO|nr:GIY-YIG endonuclease [Cordyceps cicadae]QBG64868.1 GIY-YIG endonuclease [Cordyceps cicadae]QBG64911.1 GIY-YIG endonuclease [Cordyceps cicadae]
MALTRCFSSSRVNNPESLALEHINSGKSTTSLVINKVLFNQNLSVTDSKLEELLKVEGVEINLPVSKNNELFDKLTGKSKYKGFFGVYIFIHKDTNQRYVGSSNLLRRRMDYYFKEDFPLVGKFLPLLHKEGLKAFKLIIFKLDNNKFSHQDSLILEQYYLLDKKFNLNTLRVVNAGSSKGDSVYVYDLTCNILYYHAKSKIELKRRLNIHTETSKKYVDSNIPYLNKFLLLSHPMPTVLISDISIEDLKIMMLKERQKDYMLGTRRSIAVELEIKEGNTFCIDKGLIKFNSLTSCVEYLRELGLTIKRDTLTKYIKEQKIFYNFLCKYSENILPDNFEEVGLIINEYKKLKMDKNPLNKENRKNKRILVKGVNFYKEFESITATIKYFETLNIKLDRKSLNLSLKNRTNYKNYYFIYK